MQQMRNLFFFVVAASLLIVGFIYMRRQHDPGQQQAEDKTKVKAGKKADPKKPAEVKLQRPVSATDDAKLKGLQLGDLDGSSPFHLHVQLDPLGGGIRSVTLNKFQTADVTGQPGEGPLELVPAKENLHETAYNLYHFDPTRPSAEVPLDTLGREAWEVVAQGGSAVVRDKVDGKARHRLAFRTRSVPGVVITKTYTLVEGEYHVGLRVDVERPMPPKGVAGAPAELKFRYQLTGAKGLPIEGRWYTGTFRNALIGVETGGGIARDYQEGRDISLWQGGNEVKRGEGGLIRYAGVAVQYFAAMIVVDETQAEGRPEEQRFLERARPTLETGVAHGRIKAGSLGQAEKLILSDGKRDTTIYLPPHLRHVPAAGGWREGSPVAVKYRVLSYDDTLEEAPKLAVEVAIGNEAEAMHAAWYDDITVRVATEAESIKPGATLSHSYLLYHGPVKPSLLGGQRGAAAVDRELVGRYADTLKLNTMTDYQSPGRVGRFARAIGWTYLVINTTNLMHWLLGWLYWAIPSYGIGIILLTVVVRTILFPLSRKQAIMSLKMQELAPEIRKLKDKYKDDHQAIMQGQMELFKKHGVSPFGSCWIILLQMPIFMGLYFALQESITFRLAPFWPTWIENLAAPDMMINWGRSIPWISRDQDWGGFLYLGPYFNVLPIIAVTLMIVQQKLMSPPPADEQQEMQQKMMTYMMIFFGLMFYKVAAGLCIYFIASSVWGFAERKLLPKAKLAPVTGSDAALADVTAAPSGNAAASTGVTSGKRKKGDRGKKEEEPTTWFGKLRKNFRDRLNEVLEEAKKKKPGERGGS